MANLIEIMKNVSGASFVGIDTATTPKLKGGKSNPQQGRITKVMKGASVMVFQNKNTNAYENMVQRRLEREGKSASDFTLGNRQWGQRIPNTPVIEHKGRQYLELIVLNPGKVSYLLDGQPIAKEDVEGLENRSNGEQGGLDNKVIVRDFAAESITTIRIDGETVTL